MLLTKVKGIVAFAVTFGTLALGAGLLAQPGPSPPKGGGPANTAGPRPKLPKGEGMAKEPGPPMIPANQALAREQLELIKLAEADLVRLALGGEVSFSDARFSIWGRRRLEALRAAGAGKDEIITELEKYVDSLRKEEQNARVLFQKSQATRVDTWDVQYRRIEAEMWLNQEKAR